MSNTATIEPGPLLAKHIAAGDVIKEERTGIYFAIAPNDKCRIYLGGLWTEPDKVAIETFLHENPSPIYW